jgi:hypothetical protein
MNVLLSPKAEIAPGVRHDLASFLITSRRPAFTFGKEWMRFSRLPLRNYCNYCGGQTLWILLLPAWLIVQLTSEVPIRRYKVEGGIADNCIGDARPLQNL